MNTFAKRTIKTAAVVGAVALLSGVAIAGGRGGAMGTGMMGGGMMGGAMMGGAMMGGAMGTGMMGGGMMGGAMMAPPTLAAGQLDAVKEKLNLTAEQEPAWTAYAEAVNDFRDSMRSMHESMSPDAMREMNAEERRAFAESVHASRIEDLNGIRDARDKLLQALSPEQRSTAKFLTDVHVSLR